MQSAAASRRNLLVRVLSLFLPVALVVCAGSYFIYQSEVKRQHTLQARGEQEALRTGTASINRSLSPIGGDLVYLASRLESLHLRNPESSQRLAELAADWVAFSKSQRVYDKIRWIDETGMERLRINYADPAPAVVPAHELQDKLERYFFGATMKLGAREVFVSPLDLNVDNGQVELPHKPTIRLGMPLFDDRGNRRGILMLNYSAEVLLKRFADEIGDKTHAVWLLNQEGFWLKASAPDEAFGFMFNRNELTMAQRYPRAWQTILSDESGQFVAAEGLWTFSTIHPLQTEHGIAHGKTDKGSYVWKAVSLLPAEKYNAGIAVLRAGMAGGTSLLLLLGFIALWRERRAQIDADVSSEKLAYKEARLRSLVQTIPDLIWLKNPEGTYLSCNPAFSRFVGADESTIIGKTDQDLVDTRQANFFRATDQAAIAAGKARTHEEWFTTAINGQKTLLETTKAPVTTSSGELIGVLGIARDITRRKRIENELRQSHHLLTNLTTHLPGVIYQLRMDANGHLSCPFVSDMVRTLYGLSPDQVSQDARRLFSLIHPDDSAGVEDSLRDSAKTLHMRRSEFRINHPEHGTCWIMDRALPEKQADNSITWYGILTDITERKLAEGGVQLASMVYLNSTEAIVITNAANDIIAVNPAFEQMTGYPTEEIIGQNPRLLKSGRHDQAFYESMWDDLRQHGKWQGEIWNRRKDGSIFPTWLTINTAFHEDQSVHYYVGLSSDITKLKESEKLIWKQANFDALTGLPNRNMFREHIELAFKKSVRSGLPVSLILLDLDDFKDVNDTLGHDMGDLLLQESSERLRSCVRETDVVARLGGDEFAVTLCEIPDHSIVERIAQDILRTISEPYHIKGEQLHISASVGITFYPKDGTEIETLVKNADQAMYTAKRLGRNRSHFFDPSMQADAQTRMRIVNELRAVLDGSQFTLHYQPIVDLQNGGIQRAEALLRWQHPVRGLIRPGDFIKVAEETGMIADIGNWVFREAARQVAQWRSAHHPDFQVSINMSPMQFRKDDLSGELWVEHLQQIGINGKAIVVEITEGLLLDASPNVYNQLLTLRRSGIEIAIDDFGTGYSSLAYLKKFDIDYLKIDRSFVSNLSQGSEDSALCEAIIVMAHTLGMKVVAEGIETEEQRALLSSAGCDFGQGYLFARPMTAAAFDDLLGSRR